MGHRSQAVALKLCVLIAGIYIYQINRACTKLISIVLALTHIAVLICGPLGARWFRISKVIMVKYPYPLLELIEN